MIRLCLFALLGVFLAVLFKNGKTEYGLLIGLFLSLLLFGKGINLLENAFQGFVEIKELLGVSFHYIVTLFKVVGMTYVCDISGNLCKDAGYGAVASQIELLGKMSVLVAGLPILLSLVESLQVLI